MRASCARRFSKREPGRALPRRFNGVAQCDRRPPGRRPTSVQTVQGRTDAFAALPGTVLAQCCQRQQQRHAPAHLTRGECRSDPRRGAALCRHCHRGLSGARGADSPHPRSQGVRPRRCRHERNPVGASRGRATRQIPPGPFCTVHVRTAPRVLGSEIVVPPASTGAGGPPRWRAGRRTTKSPAHAGAARSSLSTPAWYRWRPWRPNPAAHDAATSAAPSPTLRRAQGAEAGSRRRAARSRGLPRLSVLTGDDPSHGRRFTVRRSAADLRLTRARAARGKSYFLSHRFGIGQASSP